MTQPQPRNMSAKNQKNSEGDETKQRQLAKQKEVEQQFNVAVQKLESALRATEDRAQATGFVKQILPRYQMKDVTLERLEYEHENNLKAPKWVELAPVLIANGTLSESTSATDRAALYASITLSEDESAKAKADAQSELSSRLEQVDRAKRTLAQNPEAEARMNELYDLVVTSEQPPLYIAKSRSKIRELERYVGSISRKAERRSLKRQQTKTERITRASPDATYPSTIASIEKDKSQAQTPSSGSYTARTAGTRTLSSRNLSRRNDTYGSNLTTRHSKTSNNASM
jgi:hypothetical protein